MGVATYSFLSSIQFGPQGTLAPWPIMGDHEADASFLPSVDCACGFSGFLREPQGLTGSSGTRPAERQNYGVSSEGQGNR